MLTRPCITCPCTGSAAVRRTSGNPNSLPNSAISAAPFQDHSPNDDDRVIFSLLRCTNTKEIENVIQKFEHVQGGITKRRWRASTAQGPREEKKPMFYKAGAPAEDSESTSPMIYLKLRSSSSSVPKPLLFTLKSMVLKEYSCLIGKLTFLFATTFEDVAMPLAQVPGS